ncbi:MAG: hypothetical protein WBF05_09170 [Anaerolineales bacterium]
MKRRGKNNWTTDDGRQMTEDGRRTIDEKIEVQTFRVSEAAAVETVLERVGQ